MLIELYIFAFALISYGFLITLAIIGFNKLNRTIEASKHPLNLFISIIVSARNEEQTIKDFIYEIIKQNFPKTNFELIIIDDYSNDNTYELAKETLEKSGIKYKLIKQDIHCGKKKNLALAIDKSKGDIIITTDADVIYRHPNWLKSISTYFSALSPNMLIMPVDFKSESDLLSRFQITENIALTGITAGYAGIQKPFMCNGANLAFKKNIYEEVKGYQSHIHISSGEDVFLLESFAKLDTKLIHYVLLDW